MQHRRDDFHVLLYLTIGDIRGGVPDSCCQAKSVVSHFKAQIFETYWAKISAFNYCHHLQGCADDMSAFRSCDSIDVQAGSER